MLINNINNLGESIYVLIIMMITIYIYLLCNFFVLVNVFDARIIKTISDFKKFGIVQPFNFFFIILISSMAGVPPLLGFSIKFISFIFLVSTNNYFYTTLLSLFNFFTLYFYIQNIRYLINENSNNYFIYLNNFVYLSETALFILMIMLILNLFGFFYIMDINTFFQLFAI